MSEEFWKSEGNLYEIRDNDKYVIWTSGVIVYKSIDCQNAFELADMLTQGKLDHNKLIGWFRIVIYEKFSQRYYFFGDNAGSQFFFIDEKKNTFSDSLIDLRDNRGMEIKPDLRAAAQLFNLGRTLDYRTIVEGISKTNADYYYEYFNGNFCMRSKHLVSFRNDGIERSLSDIVSSIMGGGLIRKVFVQSAPVVLIQEPY